MSTANHRVRLLLLGSACRGPTVVRVANTGYPPLLLMLSGQNGFRCIVSELSTQLQNLAHIAHSPRDALAIEILKQRDRIFPRDAEQVLERADVHIRRLRLMRADRGLQLL